MSVGDVYYAERMDLERVVRDAIEKIYAALRSRGEGHPETGLLREPLEEWFRMIILDGDLMPRNAIYFVADGSLESKATGIKIGKTTDIDKRMVGLQSGNKAKLTLVAVLPQCSDHQIGERYLHRVFKRDRTRSEWFRNSDSLRNFIYTVTAVCKTIRTYRDLQNNVDT